MVGTMRRKLVCMLSAILAGSLSADAAEIRLRPQVDVRGTLILLGDLAEIRGEKSQQVESLRRIELFPAPARGRSRVVPVVEIRQLLQLHGISAIEHRFTGAESVRIAHLPDTASSLPVVAAGFSESSPKDREIVVAKQPIAAGTVIRAADIELLAVDRPVDGSGITVDCRSVIGQEATRSFSAGQPIDTRGLRQPYLVRRGETVVVVAKAAGVRVRTTAKALADAALGDLVPLESAENREKYTAVVSGHREAELYAAGPIVSDPPSHVSKRPEIQR